MATLRFVEGRRSAIPSRLYVEQASAVVARATSGQDTTNATLGSLQLRDIRKLMTNSPSTVNKDDVRMMLNAWNDKPALRPRIEGDFYELAISIRFSRKVRVAAVEALHSIGDEDTLRRIRLRFFNSTNDSDRAVWECAEKSLKAIATARLALQGAAASWQEPLQPARQTDRSLSG